MFRNWSLYLGYEGCSLIAFSLNLTVQEFGLNFIIFIVYSQTLGWKGKEKRGSHAAPSPPKSPIDKSAESNSLDGPDCSLLFNFILGQQELDSFSQDIWNVGTRSIPWQGTLAFDFEKLFFSFTFTFWVNTLAYKMIGEWRRFFLLHFFAKFQRFLYKSFEKAGRIAHFWTLFTLFHGQTAWFGVKAFCPRRGRYWPWRGQYYPRRGQ